jgi:hypothetical protein
MIKWPDKNKTNVKMQICRVPGMNKLVMLENTSELNSLLLSNLQKQRERCLPQKNMNRHNGIFVTKEYKTECQN